MSRQRSPSMQFYFRQFSGDENVQVMDLDAVGAHILLMCYAGASETRFKIPFDRTKIARLIRTFDDEKLDRILAQLLEGAWKKSECGKWLEQHGMERTLRKQKQFSKLQREKANQRWKGAEGDAESMPNVSRAPTETMLATASTSASTSTNNINTPAPSKTIKKAPEKKQFGEYVFLSDAEIAKFTKELGPVVLKRCIEKLDAWIASDPTIKRKKNGQNAGACFRSWVINAVSEEQQKQAFKYSNGIKTPIRDTSRPPTPEESRLPTPEEKARVSALIQSAMPKVIR